MPVLTLGGSASFGSRLADQIRPLVNKLEHLMIDNCGHYLAEEQPEKVLAALLSFLGAEA